MRRTISQSRSFHHWIGYLDSLGKMEEKGQRYRNMEMLRYRDTDTYSDTEVRQHKHEVQFPGKGCSPRVSLVPISRAGTTQCRACGALRCTRSSLPQCSTTRTVTTFRGISLEKEVCQRGHSISTIYQRKRCVRERERETRPLLLTPLSPSQSLPSL